MSQSPLFKRAFVRVLNAHLMREGVVHYPSKEAADSTADYVADQSGMPDPVLQRDHLNVKIAAALVNYLVQGSEHQCKRAGNRYSTNLTKTAQDADPQALAQHDAQAIMEKAASEHGDNTMGNAARHDELAQIEQERRPEGYANDGPGGWLGNWEGKGDAVVGREGPPTAPGTDTNTPVPGTNSVIEASKTGSLKSIVNRITKTATGESGPNTLTNAAERDPYAKMELEARPENYAVLQSPGDTAFHVPEGAVVGREEQRPDAEGVYETDSNSLNEHSNIGGTTKKSAFDVLFERTAKQVVPYLPTSMKDDVKVAHVRNMLGLDARGRADYLGRFYIQNGVQEKVASAYRSQFLKQAAEEEDKEKGNPFAKKDDDDKEDKGEDTGPNIPAFMQKKESSLQSIRSRLRNLSA